ncbi:tetratricopeptide repeat protein [bacterium]|nr:tetratricopeptide repeat protein [bacterium]
MECTNCSAKLPDQAKFCPECGTKTGQSKCDDCGATLRPKAKFCHECGAGVTGRFVEKSTDQPVVQKDRSVFSSVFWAIVGVHFAKIALVLVIPGVTIAIITLLFWKNKEPVPLQTSDMTASQGAPSMAAMGDVHKTLERLQKNVEENPRDIVSLDSLAIMYSIAGSYDKASKYYERHLEIEPDNKDVKIALGLTYNNLNRKEEAITLLQEVLSKEPDYAFALFYLGDILAGSGEVEAAETHWKRILEKYPNTEIAKMAEQRIHELSHTNSGSN